MSYFFEDDSKHSPFTGYREPCEKCRHSDCFSLHDYDATDCPLLTCDICPSLAKLDAEILKVHSLLVDLSKKRRNLKGKINQRHDRFIHHLPTEIVSQIFIFSEASNEYRYTRSHHRYLWPPSLILGAVCKRWRAITLSIPQLWTRVTINPWKDSSRLDITREWLDRSRALPLFLTIQGQARPKEPAPSLDDIFALLRSLFGRWKSLTLNVPYHLIRGLLNNLEGAPRMDFLQINSAERVEPGMEPISMHEFLRPKEFYARYISPMAIPVQWDNLTHLTGYMIGIDEILYIIRHATNLESCVATMIQGDGGHHPISTTPIVSTSLKSLETEASFPRRNFLRHLTLPALENLKYEYQVHIHREELDTLVTFLDRSSPSLRDFIFVYYLGDTDEVVEWYNDLPAITRLEVNVQVGGDFIGQTDNLFIALEGCADPLLLPHLRELRVVTPWMGEGAWFLFSEIFGENEGEVDGNSSEADFPSRPFESAYVQLNLQFTNPSEVPMMDEDTYFRLLEVQASGIQMKLVDELGADILQRHAGLYGEESRNTEIL